MVHTEHVEGLPDLTRMYFTISLVLLFTALPMAIQLLWRIYEIRNQCHILQLCTAWTLIANLLLIANFGTHHTYSLLSNTFLAGAHCDFGGLLSMVLVCFSVTASAAFAVITQKAMSLQYVDPQERNDIGSQPDCNEHEACKFHSFESFVRQRFVPITLMLFLPGLAYGWLVYSQSSVGNFRDLYCCVKDNGNQYVFWGGVLVFVTCGGVQRMYYMRAYKHASEVIQRSMMLSNGDSHNRGRSSARVKLGMQHSQSLARHARQQSLLFYFAWTPMMITSALAHWHGGIINASGEEAYSAVWDVVAVLCVKLMPLLDCIIIAPWLLTPSESPWLKLAPGLMYSSCPGMPEYRSTFTDSGAAGIPAISAPTRHAGSEQGGQHFQLPRTFGGKTLSPSTDAGDKTLSTSTDASTTTRRRGVRS